MLKLRVALLGAFAGLVALARDVPAAGALAAAAGAGGFWVWLLRHSGAWVPLFLALALVAPAFPIPVGGEEFPVHPASLVFALALPVTLRRLRVTEPLGAVFAAFLAWTLFSVGLAFLYSGAALGAQSLLRWLLLSQAFVMFFWMAGSEEDEGKQGGLPLQLLLACGLLAGGFAVLDFSYQFPPTVRFSEQYIYLAGGPLRRAQGVFYDASALGNFCALMLALILAVALGGRVQARVSRALLWLPVPVLAAALLLSFSRGAMLNLAAALVALAWWRRRQLLSWRAAAVALALALAAAAVVLAFPDTARLYALRLEYTAAWIFEAPNEVLSRRLEAWRFLLNFIVEHPQHFLLGVGYKTLPYTEFFGRPLVADNMYLSLLVETGVIGLALFLLFCAVVLRAAYRMSRAEDAQLSMLGGFLLAGWCGEMVQMMSGDTLTYWRVTPVYFVLLGAAVARERALSAAAGPGA